MPELCRPDEALPALERLDSLQRDDEALLGWLVRWGDVGKYGEICTSAALG